ncbi:hypothetical protein FGIG_12258 [Fasciola gigantica]|uniref:Uncharacterized protein n=1 Tax=Fasciola gigantica TaxID=46835 RepID=A0A504YV92_FASGI|nr:hypothetical protein FGIG_12258 [Fasciola gigantica]
MRRYRRKQVSVPMFSKTYHLGDVKEASVRATCATVGILNASDIDNWLNAVMRNMIWQGLSIIRGNKYGLGRLSLIAVHQPTDVGAPGISTSFMGIILKLFF